MNSTAQKEPQPCLKVLPEKRAVVCLMEQSRAGNWFYYSATVIDVEPRLKCVKVQYSRTGKRFEIKWRRLDELCERAPTT